MLKQSLLTAVILGGLAASTNAEGEVKMEDVERLEVVEPEFVFEAPEATCQAVAAEGQGAVLGMIAAEEQNASRVQEVKVARRGGMLYCLVCTWTCYWVRC